MTPEDVEYREDPESDWIAWRVRPDTSTRPWLLMYGHESMPSGFYPADHVADWPVAHAPRMHRSLMLEFGNRFPDT